MMPLRTQTGIGLWSGSRLLCGSRHFSLFHHTDASKPQSQPDKSPPAECPPRSVGDVIVGVRADVYVITEVSPWKKIGPVCRTYQATKYENDRKETFLVKELRRETQARHVLGANQSFYSHPNLQTVYDAEPHNRLLVYRAFPYNLNGLIREHPALPWEIRKEILKRALAGLVALHETNFTHLNIRPHAIFVDYEASSALGHSPFRPSNGVYGVQLGGLEDVILPHLSKESLAQYYTGIQSLPWKSPEFWIRGLPTRPSDVFSFGLTAVNLMLGDLTLRSTDTGFSLNNLMALGGLGHKVPTPQQLSKLKIWFNYFGDVDALSGLLQQVEDEPSRWYGPLSKLIKEFAFGARKPLPGLENHRDLGFVDLVTKMTHLDPSKRITAREALEHEWFANVKVGREYGDWLSQFLPHNKPGTQKVVPNDQDRLPIRKVVQDTPHIPIVNIARNDEDKLPLPKLVTPVRDLIRKVPVPLTKSSLQTYRNFYGSAPDPERVRTNPFQPKRIEPKKQRKRF